MQHDLSLATLNLLNLNLPNLPIYGKPGHTPEHYARKIAWTRQALQIAKGHVFGFQELWHRDALAEVFEGLFPEAYELLVPDEADGSRIVCAAAVRRDMLAGAPEWIEGFPDAFKLEARERRGRESMEDGADPGISVTLGAFSRPVLRFPIKPHPDAPIVQVYVCHLKSKNPTRIDGQKWYRDDRTLYKPHTTAIGAGLSTVRRTAEATALRILLDGALTGDLLPAVVLGDLNDGHLSNTLNIITGQPTYLHSTRSGGGDKWLYSGQALQEYRSQRDVYYTYIYKGIHQSLDHILVSEEFYDRSSDRIWSFQGMDVYNDHLNQIDASKSAGAIDHGLACAHFKFEPTGGAKRKMRR